jgi:hypothetical protein
MVLTVTLEHGQPGAQCEHGLGLELLPPGVGALWIDDLSLLPSGQRWSKHPEIHQAGLCGRGNPQRVLTSWSKRPETDSVVQAIRGSGEAVAGDRC